MSVILHNYSKSWWPLWVGLCKLNTMKSATSTCRFGLSVKLPTAQIHSIHTIHEAPYRADTHNSGRPWSSLPRRFTHSGQYLKLPTAQIHTTRVVPEAPYSADSIIPGNTWSSLPRRFTKLGSYLKLPTAQIHLNLKMFKLHNYIKNCTIATNLGGHFE